MAIDWNKEISFAGLKKRKPKASKGTLPSKRYINLMPRKERKNDPRKVIPIAVLLIVLVAVFVKFGVYDFYDQVAKKQAELNTQTQLLQTALLQSSDYETVKEEYEGYESTKLAASDTEVSATEALKLVDTLIAPKARIESVSYDGSAITLKLGGISLDEVGKLVNSLYDQEIVKNVTVSTAGSDTSKSEELTASMVITVQKA